MGARRLRLCACGFSRRRSLAGPTAGAEATFVGGKACIECHRKAYEAWLGSDHDHAMAPADERSVLGDFDDAVFEHGGITSRFYRRDGRYYVHTEGPGGEMGEFEIEYTFGWEPLQQYLIRFPGGRLQALSIAWDVDLEVEGAAGIVDVYSLSEGVGLDEIPYAEW